MKHEIIPKGGIPVKSALGRISIKWRIFSYLVGFCVLLLLILWTFQTVLLGSFYKGIKTEEVRREANIMMTYIQEGNWDALSDTVAARKDLYVEVWLQDFGTWLVSANYPEGIQARLTQEEKILLFETVLADEDHFVRRIYAPGLHSGQKQESILYASLLPWEDSAQSLLMVSANISPVTATVKTLRVQLYYISGAMLLLSVLIALLLSKRISRPIERLNTTAGELGRGNYGVTFSGEGYREIAQLSDTLNIAARELGKTEALRQDLIANVSHDLRTPLTLITGYGEMIRDLPGEDTPENMQVIIDEAKRLTSLVNNLLDLSRIQSGSQELRLAPCALTAGIRELIGRYDRFCRQDGYTILFQQEAEVEVMADADRILQVIYNLLNNAVTYTGADKRVLISQTVEDGRVTVAVSDTGEGISPEDLPHIWDRYYRVDKVHKRAEEGSGLGLSIVKGVLEQHPGMTYGVESTPGQGSRFWFSLPVLQPQ